MKTLRELAGIVGCLLLLLSASACHTCGLGQVPSGLIDLYDHAKPDGLMEIEINRCGCITGMEADIEIDALPEAVRKMALAKAPGAEITGAERELQSGGEAWEVKLRFEDRDWEDVIREDGTVLEVEKELRREEAPAVVLTAAAEAVPGAAFRSVELITHGKQEEYHVKQTRDGASYKIVLAADGRVIRAVREARTEIEIPLEGM